MKEELLKLKKDFFNKYPFFDNYFSKEELTQIEKTVKENEITYEELYEELNTFLSFFKECDSKGKDIECAYLAQYICSFFYSIDFVKEKSKSRM